MKNELNKMVQISFAVCMILLAVTINGCGNDHKGHDHSNTNNDETKVDSSIIRAGVIDLQSLDSNKDGMVYQDPMDWNVISDEPGKCPLCNMTLKEFTLEEAKVNLMDSGFKVIDKKN